MSEEIRYRSYEPAADGPSAPPGWYLSDGVQRYWDGVRWTEHTAPAAMGPGPTASPAYRSTLELTDERHRTGETVAAWLLTVLTTGYLLPWAVAATRGKSNSTTIGVVNLLLGWTIVGWIVALVMACRPHRQIAWRPV